MILLKQAATIGFVLLSMAFQGGSCGSSSPQRSTSKPPPNQSTANMNSSKPTDTSPSTRTLREGAWGGEHVVLTVKADSAAIEFDCAHGEINQPIRLDSEGNFDVEGSFVREGGPVRVGEEKGIPARYHGRVEGERMKLAVTLKTGNQHVGDFTLGHGKPPRLRKCY